jgi:aminoglycoside phosphotransferase
MSVFSSNAHVPHIVTAHRVPVIDDPVLPAAAHLTGPHAGDVLRAAVEAAGGSLESCRPVHVQYRPGSDVTVRYAASVRDHDGSLRSDTLVAGVTRDGAPPGTVPVEALTADGGRLEAGVWRWPFDPALPDLPGIVTPNEAAVLLAGHVEPPVSIEVVVYRPTERVVARVVDATGTERYVKVVAPAAVAPLVERHERLADAGLPVPRVVASGHSWIAMEALRGPTLRDLVKGTVDDVALPAPHDVLTLSRSIARADLGHHRPIRPRLLDAAAHARMLATVVPGEAGLLTAVAERFDAEAVVAESRPRTIIHGDLHEGQLIVSATGIVGIIDVDDAGPGDPLDDVATLLGHLRYRALTDDVNGSVAEAYADDVREAFLAVASPDELDTVTAGVLVGLATGPFRVQQDDWQRAVRKVIDAAVALLPRTPSRPGADPIGELDERGG